MRIRTQFILTMVLFGIVLVAIASSEVVINQRVKSAAEQENLAWSISQKAGELSYLANNYIILPENQKLKEWQTVFASFSADVGSLRVSPGEQQALAKSMQDGAQQLALVFAGASPTPVASPPGAASDPALLRVSWGPVAAQSQALAADASALAQLLDAQGGGLETTSTIIIAVLIGIFFAYFVANFLLTQRRVLHSLAEFQNGAAVVGSGNLNFRVQAGGNDEIGDLSRAFNHMTSSLKEATATRAELEKEISERKRAEQEIIHLASFPRLNPNPIIELDARGVVLYANPAALKVFPDLEGSNAGHPVLRRVRETIAAGETGPLVLDIELDGRWYEQRVAFVESSRTFRIYFRDITARKQAEGALRQRNVELEAANKELEAFSYSVSHDLRAPLRSMEGFSSALLEDYGEKLDAQGKRYLGYVQEASDLMGRLIDDLLKLSRVTRSEMNYEQVNLSELAAGILRECALREPERKTQFDIEPDLIAHGDPSLLKLALGNLLENAWKFSGKIEVTRIEMGVLSQDEKRVFFIRDHGAGFDMTYVDKLFRPFQRLHKPAEFAGTGIGLATVQRIIHRHGGKIWAESRIGEGSTFYFTLE